jgi:hypothetical protein
VKYKETKVTNVGLQPLMAMKIQTAVLWVVTPCSYMVGYQYQWRTMLLEAEDPN